MRSLPIPEFQGISGGTTGDRQPNTCHWDQMESDPARVKRWASGSRMYRTKIFPNVCPGPQYAVNGDQWEGGED